MRERVVPKPPRIITIFLLAVVVGMAGGCTDDSSSGGGAAEPRPEAPRRRPRTAVDPYQQFEGLPGPTKERSPEEVVRLMVEAMGRNDETEGDAGLKTVYNFASPGNKRMTGPFERFNRMIRGPAYMPMLIFERAEYGPIEVRGDQARQPVKMTDANGNTTVYMFMLSRQDEGPFEGCWMSDAVRPLPLRPREPDGGRDEPTRRPV